MPEYAKNRAEYHPRKRLSPLHLGTTAQFVVGVSGAIWTSASCNFLDYGPGNLRNLQLQLPQIASTTAPTHLCGVTFIPSSMEAYARNPPCQEFLC